MLSLVPEPLFPPRGQPRPGAAGHTLPHSPHTSHNASTSYTRGQGRSPARPVCLPPATGLVGEELSTYPHPWHSQEPSPSPGGRADDQQLTQQAHGVTAALSASDTDALCCGLCPPPHPQHAVSGDRGDEVKGAETPHTGLDSL